MKKKQIISLIQYHVEGRDQDFRDEASEIASYFERIGDHQLAHHISMLLSNANIFVPQSEDVQLEYCRKVELDAESLIIPDSLKRDIQGVINAIYHNAGVHKFLFEGAPGTGKSKTVSQIARILGRELYVVDFEHIIDSKLGQTAKNIASLFCEINTKLDPQHSLILLDELDGIAIDRVQSNDLREMGRATTAVLKGLDSLYESVVLIATTNLYDVFDKALTRRFDAVINFDRYTQQDLIAIASSMLEEELKKFNKAGKNKRLFSKIMQLMDTIPNPGELRNTLRMALAFSDPSDEYDYLKRLLLSIREYSAQELKEHGFTVREIGILTGVSKSNIARKLSDITPDTL